jgi:hypothetical protein
MAIKAAGDLLAIDDLSSSGRHSLAYKGRDRAPASPFPHPCTPCTALPSHASSLIDLRRRAIAGQAVGGVTLSPSLLSLSLHREALTRGLSLYQDCPPSPLDRAADGAPPSSSTSGRRRRSPPPPLPQRPSRLQLVAVVVSKISLASFYFSPNRITSCRSPAPRRPPHRPWCPCRHPSRLLEPVVGFA